MGNVRKEELEGYRRGRENGKNLRNGGLRSGRCKDRRSRFDGKEGSFT